MKRHAALHPLSRDHHNVLVHARRLRGLDARIDAAAARRSFLAYFDAVLRHHLAEEEEILLPKIRDVALRTQLLDEHADLRRRTAALPDGQTELGEALRLHIRFEEDVLFPHLEGVLSDADWQAVTDATLTFRQKARPASLADGEACFL